MKTAHWSRVIVFVFHHVFKLLSDFADVLFGLLGKFNNCFYFFVKISRQIIARSVLIFIELLNGRFYANCTISIS